MADIKNVITRSVALGFLILGSPSLFGYDACDFGHCAKFSQQTISLCQKLFGSEWSSRSLDLDDSTKPGGQCSCPCSCVIGSTRVLLRNGKATIRIDQSGKGQELFTPGSAYGFSSIEKMAMSQVKKSDMWSLAFSNEASLLVSPNHTFITKERKVIGATDLKVGDYVLDDRDLPVHVTKSELKKGYTGNLYNLILNEDSKKPTDHVFLTEGIQSGDWLLQSTHDLLNREIDLRLGQIQLTNAK